MDNSDKLGKVGESLVATNLNDKTFMDEYFSRYETALDQMVNGGTNQKDYVIILEPDMYGKLVQDQKMKNNDATTVPVNMTKANMNRNTNRTILVFLF